MTERLQPHGPGQYLARTGAPPPATDLSHASTVPRIPLARVGADDDPTILGFPTDPEDDDEDELDSVGHVVVLRHADRFGGTLLVLAGIAAALSLVLPWLPGDGGDGLSLVQRGVDLFRSGVDAFFRSDFWPPLAVVLGGGLLLLLGLLLFIPAHAHRFVGLLALVVAMATAVAMLVLFDTLDWRIEQFDIGIWFAVAVPALGLLGALKALLTAPRVTIRSS